MRSVATNDVKNTDRIRSEIFRSKIVTADDAAALIHDGAAVGFSGFVGAGYPKAVPEALAKRAHALHANEQDFSIKVYTGASTDHALDGILAEEEAISFRTPFSTDGALRKQINSGEVGYIDTHLSHLAQQVEEGFFDHLDFAVIEISGIDENGDLIPSTSLGNNKTYIEQADKVILEVNEWQPEQLDGVHDVYYSIGTPPNRQPIPLNTAHDRIGIGRLRVDPDKVVAVIETEGGDRNTKFTPLDECSKAIGDNVVEFFKQEEAAGHLPEGRLLPLQSGIGNVANAVLAGLERAGYQGLECYSEVIQDGMLDLIKSGTVELASATALSLSPDAVDEFRDNIDFYNKHILLRPQEISNNPELIRRIGVVAMNGMLEADIYGNVNSTHIMGTKMMNGIGGSGDFARNGYISIFLSPSTAKNGNISAIVPFASHIDHTEHDTMVVVTEFGFADLRGKTPRQRAEAMIAIAHPDYRDQLRDYFDRANAQPNAGQTPHILPEALSWHQRFLDTGSMKQD
ncbi:acetyl-CoA hydrolase/transferase family protein [Pseudoclavibacter sp. CFCC 13796]|nr:acetyl-CoA hydrolase/transferase family protein [Pseudoclavibacter sp. CFCC 13796]